MGMITKTFYIADSVQVGNKEIKLNLNVYRNLHFQINNKAKIIFKNMLLNEYPELERINTNHITVSYTIIPIDKRKFDTMNIISIVDKFFLDALIEIGVIPDDNYNFVDYGEIKTEIPLINNYKKRLIKADVIFS